MKTKTAVKLINYEIKDEDHHRAKSFLKKKNKAERQNKRKARMCQRKRK